MDDNQNTGVSENQNISGSADTSDVAETPVVPTDTADMADTADITEPADTAEEVAAEEPEAPVETTEEVAEEVAPENPAEAADTADVADSADTADTAEPEETITEVEPHEETEAEEKEEAEAADETDVADTADIAETADEAETPANDVPGAHWYVVHTYSGHENRVAAALKQRIESEHLEGKILDVLVPTQEKIEIRSGKKENVKEKIFPGYILVRMVLDDLSWLAVRTTQGVTSFVGMSNKPTAIPDREVKSIVSYMTQGAQPTYKTTFSENDTVKIVDGPFAEFIGKVESVDKERGKIKVLVSIFGRETPVELDFLQVTKL